MSFQQPQSTGAQSSQHAQTGQQAGQYQQPQQMSGQQSQQQQPQAQGGEQMLTQQSQSDGTIEQSLPQVMQQALFQFNEAAKVCEWCAERCVGEGQMMAECLRLCRDVADIASLNARFIARDSPYGPELAETFITVAQACAQECAQHNHAHCQDCARVLGEAIQSTQQLLGALPSMGSQQMQSQQGGQQGQIMQGQSQQGGQSAGAGMATSQTSGQFTTGSQPMGGSSGQSY